MSDTDKPKNIGIHIVPGAKIANATITDNTGIGLDAFLLHEGEITNFAFSGYDISQHPIESMTKMIEALTEAQRAYAEKKEPHLLERLLNAAGSVASLWPLVAAELPH